MEAIQHKIHPKQEGVLAYLNQLTHEEKEALSRLRTHIQRIKPGMEERLSRGVPFFYYLGKRVVGYRASKTHLSFFIMEGKVMKMLRHELQSFNYSATVIRFNAKNPLPDSLIEQLVLARIAEINEKNRTK